MSETRILWGRVSRGLSCIGFGVFFLLATQGFLHRGFWLDALAYWPVLLIALGLRLMFQHSRTPWAVLVSPLVIMGTLSYVAWRGPVTLSAEWSTVRAARDPGVERWSLDAEMALADLEVRAVPGAPGLLLQGRTAPADLGRVRVTGRGDSSRVRLRSDRWDSGTIRFLPIRRHRWEVDVTNDLPVALRLATSFAEGELDLATIEVTRADLDGAFNDLTLRLGTPRSDTRVNVEGAFNRLELVVPEDTPVRVSTNGVNNLVDRRSNRGELSGPAYRLRADGAFNRVVIRSN